MKLIFQQFFNRKVNFNLIFFTIKKYNFNHIQITYKLLYIFHSIYLNPNNLILLTFFLQIYSFKFVF